MRAHAISVSVTFAALLVLLLQPALTGCGSGGGSEGVALREVRGMVNRSEIGGDGLRITTAYKEAALLDGNGEFNITVSAEGAQLVFTHDTAGQIRGLAVSVPNAPHSDKQQLTVDAASTAGSLVFMTPGILSTNPAEATSRTAEIRGLSSFQPLLRVVRQQLSTGTLDDLVQNEAFNMALDECIHEFVSKQDGRSRVTRSINVGPPASKGYVTLSLKDGTNPAAAVMQLTNAGWRYVNVQRRDIRNDVEVAVIPVADGIHSMKGAKALSWGSLFTGSVAEPAKLQDIVNLGPDTGAMVSQYWITGPGFVAGGDDLPPTVNDNALDAWVFSIGEYVALPLASLILGLPDGGVTIDVIREVLDSIKAEVAWEKLFGATDVHSAARALLDFAVPVASAIIRAIGSHGVKSIILTQILKPGAILMSSANLIVTAENWFTTPRVVKVEITTTGSTGVVVR